VPNGRRGTTHHRGTPQHMEIPTIENLIPTVIESTNRGERAFDI
jgi:hypothetical protein